MAYRIRNFDNLSVHQVDEIFRRGRGLDRGNAPANEGEDFTANTLAHSFQQADTALPSAEVVDDELELVR